MKLQYILTVTREEKIVLDELEQEGWKRPAGLTVEIVPCTIPDKGDKTPSKAPIGKEIDGVLITHYGYPGDSSPDSGSMAGLGDRSNKLVPNMSVALTHSQRHKLFGVTHPSTGKEFIFAGCRFMDSDTAPEKNPRIDVYDPYHEGRDPGCTDDMFAKSKAEMVKAGILV